MKTNEKAIIGSKIKINDYLRTSKINKIAFRESAVYVTAQKCFSTATKWPRSKKKTSERKAHSIDQCYKTFLRRFPQIFFKIEKSLF